MYFKELSLAHEPQSTSLQALLRLAPGDSARRYDQLQDKYCRLGVPFSKGRTAAQVLDRFHIIRLDPLLSTPWQTDWHIYPGQSAAHTCGTGTNLVVSSLQAGRVGRVLRVAYIFADKHAPAALAVCLQPYEQDERFAPATRFKAAQLAKVAKELVRELVNRERAARGERSSSFVRALLSPPHLFSPQTLPRLL